MSNVNASVRHAVDSMTGVALRQKRSGFVRQRTRERLLSLHRCAAKWMAKSISLKSPDENTANFKPDFSNKVHPYVRFRRIAKAVALLLKVCKVCTRIVYESVSSEEWFTLVGKFVEGEDKFFESNPIRKPRPFVTFVPVEDKGELVQLSFDKSEFSRENRSDHLLTDAIRNVLRTDPGQRTTCQENELVRFLKRLSTDFNGYPMETQRRLAKCLYYDRYYPSRILSRQGLMADTVFFVLSGTLVEKVENKRRLRELKPGDRYGEDDIICGCPRRSTVVTNSTVELLSVHRIDYRAIFNMADDSNNPRYLEICRQDIVFQHFPLRKLMENSGTWAVLSYKFGRLMVKDSNDMEWIYIIKSGEARVLKHLKTTHMDIDARKRKQKEKLSHNKDALERKMIDFISDKRYMSSHYRTGQYAPTVITRQRKPILAFRQNAVQHEGSEQIHNTKQRTKANGFHSSAERTSSPIDTVAPCNLFKVRPQSQPFGCQEKESVTEESQRAMTLSRIQHRGDVSETTLVHDLENGYVHDDTDTDEDATHNRTIRIQLPEAELAADDMLARDPESSQFELIGESNKKSGILQTALVKLPNIEQQKAQKPSNTKRSPRLRRVPPFVLLETLRTGKVFGFRSCLEPEERGPSVSLVSAGCEVLQINKKFFMKHADEAVLGLIKAKYRAFPSEEDMLERLDDSLEWQEFKETTVREFMRLKGRTTSHHINREGIEAV